MAPSNISRISNYSEVSYLYTVTIKLNPGVEEKDLPIQTTPIAALCSVNLRNGKRAACNHRVIDASGRLRKKRKSTPQATLASWCLANLPSVSITQWLHSCNVYHCFYSIIKREKHFHLPSVESMIVTVNELMYAVIYPRVNKSCFQKLAFEFFSP